MLVLSPTEAKVLLLGLKARPYTPPSWPTRVWEVGGEAVRSHRIRLVSVVALPEAKVLPSGLKATVLILPGCPVRAAPFGRGDRPRSPLTSHRMMVRSSPAEAIVLPSGLKATLMTQPECLDRKVLR
jgi:hypothetical protein